MAICGCCFILCVKRCGTRLVAWQVFAGRGKLRPSGNEKSPILAKGTSSRVMILCDDLEPVLTSSGARLKKEEISKMVRRENLCLPAIYSRMNNWRWNRFFAFSLCGLSIISALRIHPNYTSYFNLLSGGPTNGWRLQGKRTLKCCQAK